MFHKGFFIFINERFAHSLIFGEHCERIAQVAHQKWAMWENRSGRSPKMSNVSESLRSLTKNERPWEICSGRSPKMSDHERITQVAHQKWANEWITRFWANHSFAHLLQITSDSLRKPMSEFPTLRYFTAVFRTCEKQLKNICIHFSKLVFVWGF